MNRPQIGMVILVQRGPDLPRARRVLDYMGRAWRRPVRLRTLGLDGEPAELAA